MKKKLPEILISSERLKRTPSFFSEAFFYEERVILAVRAVRADRFSVVFWKTLRIKNSFNRFFPDNLLTPLDDKSYEVIKEKTDNQRYL